MKKISIILAGLACLILTSCGGLGSTLGSSSSSTTGSILGSVLGAVTNGGTITNVLSSVIGTDKPSASYLVNTWYYKEPGVAFTSENLLAKAGGEVAASTVKEKLTSYYSGAGIKSSNTYIQFNSDGSFSAKIAGKSFSGSYTYDESSAKITMKSLLLTLPAYAKKTSNGLSVLFESKKLLSALQAVSAISGNSNLQAIGTLSKNYDGVRMGFDMKD